MTFKINKIALLAPAFIFLAQASYVFAQPVGQGSVDPNKIKITAPAGAISNIPVLISWAIQLLFVVAGLIAFVYLLLGGIKWITSGGDKGQVEAARNQIIQALIGLVVVFAAWGIIVLVEKMLGIGLGFSGDLSLPTPKGLQDPL